MADHDELHAYYERDRERDRLASGVGRLEFERTIDIIGRTLPAAPAVVADIGGGPGRYTDWLVAQGYDVTHRDIVPHHVEQVVERHGERVDAAVGDARRLDLADESVDAVLLLGPLYHLDEEADRRLVVAEAARVVRSGGMVYTAAIVRWAVRVQGLLVERLYKELPDVVDRVPDVEATGILPTVIEGGFTGYCHTPAQFRDEIEHPELDVVGVAAVESVAALFSDAEIEERLDDPVSREVLLTSLQVLESIPDLMGASGHLLGSARRR